MRLRTDDDIYRARLVYLGPPGYTLPIQLPYAQYGLFVLLVPLFMFIHYLFTFKVDLFPAWDIALAIVALAVVLGLLWRARPAANRPELGLSTTTRVALALLAAGILGNLIDRLWHGQVTDFLHFYYRRYEYPSFNVADSCICVAAALLILGSLRSGRDKTATHGPTANPPKAQKGSTD